jgi:hypothetical protein
MEDYEVYLTHTEIETLFELSELEHKEEGSDE